MSVNSTHTKFLRYGGLVYYQMSAGEIITGIAIILLGFVVFMFLCCLYISKCGTVGCESCCGISRADHVEDPRGSRYQEQHPVQSRNDSNFVPELRGLEDLEQYLEDRCLADLPAYIRETIERPPRVTDGMVPGKPVPGIHPLQDDPPPTYEEAVKVIEEERRKKDGDDGPQQSTSRE